MNRMIRHELKTGFKPFIFWMLGLAFLTLGGMFKITGFDATSGVDINVLFAQFPRIILAMLGISNVDIQTLGGFYSVLENYVLIITAIFAIYLGSHAVSREMIDKTYEFIFTKPRTRTTILFTKLLTAFVYLFAFCLFNLLFSFAALRLYGIENTISLTIVYYALASLIVGLIFFSLAAVLSASFSRSEMGMKLSNAVMIVVFILSVFFDLEENPGLIQLFTPLRYFTARDLIAGHFDLVYLAVSLGLSAIFILFAFAVFKRKDLKAV